jgi:hypothetical protein
MSAFYQQDARTFEYPEASANLLSKSQPGRANARYGRTCCSQRDWGDHNLHRPLRRRLIGMWFPSALA